jgi:hypothetical protein
MHGILGDYGSPFAGLLVRDSVTSVAAALIRSQGRATYLRPLEYKPGDTVAFSGIYKVVHDLHHVADHEVTCVRGEPFPPCNHCGPHPRFTLVRAAHHVSNHSAFAK